MTPALVSSDSSTGMVSSQTPARAQGVAWPLFSCEAPFRELSVLYPLGNTAAAQAGSPAVLRWTLEAETRLAGKQSCATAQGDLPKITFSGCFSVLSVCRADTWGGWAQNCYAVASPMGNGSHSSHSWRAVRQQPWLLRGLF